MVAFPNPDTLELHFDQLEHGSQLGDRHEAARAAGVKPGTISVWVSRGKIEPVIAGPEPLFHIPTVQAAARAGRKYTPSDPAANSRRPHRHTAA